MRRTAASSSMSGRAARMASTGIGAPRAHALQSAPTWRATRELGSLGGAGRTRAMTDPEAGPCIGYLPIVPVPRLLPHSAGSANIGRRLARDRHAARQVVENSPNAPFVHTGPPGDL